VCTYESPQQSACLMVAMETQSPALFGGCYSCCHSLGWAGRLQTHQRKARLPQCPKFCSLTHSRYTCMWVSLTPSGANWIPVRPTTLVISQVALSPMNLVELASSL
jgi:hypothetical protein